MCFNFNKRILFVGTSDSFSTHLGGNFNSLVPAVYALECNGYELAMIDKVEIPEVSASLGVFTVHSHPSENIVFCTFTTKVLLAVLQEGSFKKFRVIENFSDTNVYQSCLTSQLFCGYCPKEESLNMLTFAEKPIPNSNSYQWSNVHDSNKAGKKDSKAEDKQGPLLVKYSYSIPEFKDNVKFALVDTFMGFMFMFTDQEIFKCVITRKSLVLEEKSANFGN